MKIRLEGLEVKYGKTKALEDVSFELQPGEILSLVGPNGSGKSTLIKAVAGIHRPSAGHIFINGMDLLKVSNNEMAKLIGYVPQNFHYLFFSTVMETVMLGRKPHIGWNVSQNDLDMVQQALDDMNIAYMADKFMDQLSGGEKQKVYIAKALAQEPKLFLFDEPTSNLDLKHQVEVLDITRRITKQKGSSMIVALHDLNLALAYSDKIVMLKKGRVFDQGAPDQVLTPENILKVYDVNVLMVESPYGKHIVPMKAKSV